MKPKKLMVRVLSSTGHNYATIRITQSRINKGLLAIPVALIDWFPKKNTQVQVLLGDSPVPKFKNFTAYNSSSHECRIGGLADWFMAKQIRDGDEIVIQQIDKENHVFRLIAERKFIEVTQKLQKEFDSSRAEKEARENLIKISKWTNVDKEIARLSEFQRLAKELKAWARVRIVKKESKVKEEAPANLKLLIGEIYLGHCQVCDFWFLKKDKTPYYEIHHIDDMLGNYLQNLLSVCGNCHNQFTYTRVKHEFKDNWLSRVHFNDRTYNVNQITFSRKFEEATKEVFVMG